MVDLLMKFWVQEPRGLGKIMYCYGGKVKFRGWICPTGWFLTFKSPCSHHHQNGGHYPKYLASGLYIFHWWQKLGIQTNQVWRSHNACWSILIWHDLMFRAREMRNLVCSSLKNCNLVTNFDSYVFRIRCTVAFSSRGEKIFDRRGKGYVSKMSLTPKTNLYIGLVQFLWMAAYKRW